MSPQDALRAMCVKYGNQKGLADALGVSPQTISYWKYNHVPRNYVPILVELSDNRLKETDFRPDINWRWIKQWAS